jgi:hypothetical protein
MKKLIILLLVVYTNFNAYAQNRTGKALRKTFVDKETGFQLTYPDTVAPVILKSNEDIKSHIEPFVIEIKKVNHVQVKNGDSLPDDCYKFTRVYKNKHKVELKEFVCIEGAAGHLYYTFLYEVENTRYTISIKFLHKHRNVATDKDGKVKPFSDKDIRWVTDIIESAKFTRQNIKG